MKLVENFNGYLEETDGWDLTLPEIFEELNEIGADNLDPYLTEELDEMCVELYYHILNEEESDEGEGERRGPQSGDLAKAAISEIGKAAVFGWVVGKVITGIITPVADKAGAKLSSASTKLGDKARIFGTGAGKEVAKEYKVSKKAVSDLAKKAKSYPIRTAGVAVGIIIAATTARKLYKKVKERKELEAKKENYRLSNDAKLQSKIASLESKIEALKKSEQKIKNDYQVEVKKEREEAKKKTEEDPQYAVKLVKKAESDLNKLDSM